MPAPLHINIAEPCHENWQQMTPNEQGRHCLSCQKTVVDFTRMSDQEILHYISRASSSVCGRFYNHQLDKTYEEKKVKSAFTFRYAWNLLVATFLITGSTASAQVKEKAKKKTAVKKEWAYKHTLKNLKLSSSLGFVVTTEPQGENITLGTFPVVKLDEEQSYTQEANEFIKIFGVIIDDSTGKPVSFASVRIKGQKAGVAADEAGSFSIAMPAKKAAMALVISSVGYANKEIDVTGNERRSYQVRLSPVADNLEPVEVVLLSSISCGRGAPHPFIKKDKLPVSIDSALQGTVGRVIVTQDVTVVEKAKQEVKEWLPTQKEVRIYPNPVMPGNTVNISLKLNKTGEYKLELMDAAGRVVHIQALQIAQKEQVINVPTQSAWSRGIYLIRISNATGRKVYQAKLLLQ